jgi:hypothetical protein
MLFEVGCGDDRDGRECLPVYLILKHHNIAKSIFLKDKKVIINTINSKIVSKIINFVQKAKRHSLFEKVYNQTSISQ